jgi:two-component system, NarL family, nitrate/nitrite response regulator NarL
MQRPPTRAASVGSSTRKPSGGRVDFDTHRGWMSAGSRVPRERQSTVVVVDERHLFVEALAALLGSSGFLVTTSAPDDAAAAAIALLEPDLVLVGAGPRHEQSLRLVEALHQVAPEVQTVIVADSQDPELIRCVLEESAAALVLTTVTGEDLAFMLEQVLRGNAVLPTGWQSVLAESAHNPVASLSPRQLEVLRLLADGCSYEQISSRLVITVNTVKFHVRSIYLQLGVTNRMAAARALEATLASHATHPVS